MPDNALRDSMSPSAGIIVDATIIDNVMFSKNEYRYTCKGDKEANTTHKEI